MQSKEKAVLLVLVLGCKEVTVHSNRTVFAESSGLPRRQS